MSVLEIDWTKLAEIKELKEFFEEDSFGFQQLIEHYIEQSQQFSEEDLDKLALLRVLEVTNGCVQWGFRRKDEQSLSTEDTRACMHKVMEFIKQKTMCFPSKGTINFDAKLIALIDQGRTLYNAAFKQHAPGKEREYYASSTAQFIVYGCERLEAAMKLVKQDYEAFFSPYYIERGRDYIARYLACLQRLTWQ